MAAPKMERTRYPGIYKRGGRYVVVWRHRGRQHKSYHRTIGEAREAKGRRASGESRPASREPFEDYAVRWLETYRGRTSRGLGERTRRTYRRDMTRWVIPFLRGYKLEEVEPPDVRALIGHLEDAELRPASIRAIVAPMKAMYATAVEDGAVRSNPTRSVRIGGRESESREVRALTRAELARVLDKLPAEWRLMFELLAQTGLRISEAIALTWGDVEFGERPRLLIRRQDCRGEVGALKSEHSRRDVPLSPATAARLWEIGADSPSSARVFTSPTGEPLRYENLRRRVLIPVAREAGLSWVSGFHTFRHTCASLLFEAGRDVKQVSAWLGHADAGFTLRTYVHLMDEGIGDAAFMDAAVGNGWATQHPETGHARENADPAESAV